MKDLDLAAERGEAAAFLDDMAADHGLPPDEVLGRGLAIIAAARLARAQGATHLGVVSDARKLDIRVTGVL